MSDIQKDIAVNKEAIVSLAEFMDRITPKQATVLYEFLRPRTVAEVSKTLDAGYENIYRYVADLRELGLLTERGIPGSRRKSFVVSWHSPDEAYRIYNANANTWVNLYDLLEALREHKGFSEIIRKLSAAFLWLAVLDEAELESPGSSQYLQPSREATREAIEWGEDWLKKYTEMFTQATRGPLYHGDSLKALDLVDTGLSDEDKKLAEGFSQWWADYAHELSPEWWEKNEG